MKTFVLLLISLFCISVELRQLDYMFHLPNFRFDIDKDEEVLADKKTINFVEYRMDCFKLTKYVVRGGYGDTRKCYDILLKEANELYPEDAKKCTYTEIAKGTIERDGKLITIKPKEDNLYGELIRYNLSHEKEYQGFKIIVNKNK